MLKTPRSDTNEAGENEVVQSSHDDDEKQIFLSKKMLLVEGETGKNGLSEEGEG